MSDYWPFYLRECRSPIVMVHENPDGRTDQEIWDTVGYQHEAANLEVAYYQVAEWVRTNEEEELRKRLAEIIEAFEIHTYDRLAAQYRKPSDELKITPKFIVGLDSSLTDCGASWTPEQEYLSTVPDGYNDFFN